MSVEGLFAVRGEVAENLFGQMARGLELPLIDALTFDDQQALPLAGCNDRFRGAGSLRRSPD